MATIDFKYKIGQVVDYYGSPCTIHSRAYMEIRNTNMIRYTLVDNATEDYYSNISEQHIEPHRARLRIVK